MFHQKKTRKKRVWPIVTGVVILLMLALVCGAGLLFREELKIIGSVRKESEDQPVYYMEFDNTYHFDEFLNSGGASSDQEVSAFLTKCISKGFYRVDVEQSGPACSVLSALDADESHLWGRNFDWAGSVPIIVKCVPKDGYASISTCDFQNITGDFEKTPDDIVHKMLAIAALYVPLDGINEAGLCVADLQVNEGGMKDVDTGKPDLTITTAIRLVLNKAATVYEAVSLLEQYDIHASAGISHHIAISDASGASVVLEFIDGKMVSVPTSCVTNFNLVNGDTAAGGESSRERYEILSAIHADNDGVLTLDQVRGALLQVSQSAEEQSTQWSVVFEQQTQRAEYWFKGDEEKIYSYSLKD